MQTEIQDVSADGIDLVSVDHFNEYPVGLPVWVAITIRAHPDTALHRLLFADLVDLRSSIGVEMIGPSMTRREVPIPFIHEEGGIKPQSLMPGEARRMLADISPLTGANVPEGQYRMRLTYLSPRLSLKSKPFHVQFRRPDAAEQKLLAHAVASGRRFANWVLWMRACGPKPLTLSDIPPASPAALTFVLNYLFCGPEKLSSIGPETLESFTAIPSPEKMSLQAELLFARGDTARFEQLRDRALTESPGLSWWISRIERGGGFLKTFSKRSR